MFHQPLTRRVIWSRTGFMGTAQKAQFLHQVIFKFPTLIRMDDGWHTKPADDQLKKCVSNGHGCIVGQRTGLRPSGKTVNDYQCIAVALRSCDGHVQKVHGQPIPPVTHLDMPHGGLARARGLLNQTDRAAGQKGTHILP